MEATSLKGQGPACDIRRTGRPSETNADKSEAERVARKERAGGEGSQKRTKARRSFAQAGRKRFGAMNRRAGAGRQAAEGAQERRTVTESEAAAFRAHIRRRVVVLRENALAHSMRRKKCSHWETWLVFCERSRRDPVSFASLENPTAGDRRVRRRR